MADYNIYIHSYGQYDSPTTPFQTRAESDTSGVGGEGGGSGGSGFGAVRRAAAFLTNPDSAVGQVMGKAGGALKTILPFAIIAAIGAVVKRGFDLYVPYAASASGDYAFQMQYNNFWTNLHNITHPFSTEIQRQQMSLERRKESAKNEQERLLVGKTIYSYNYGRTL